MCSTHRSNFIRSVFSKTMENVLLVTVRIGRYGVEIMIAKSNFHSRNSFREPDRNRNAKIRNKARQTDIRKYVYLGDIQHVFIWTSSRVYDTASCVSCYIIEDKNGIWKHLVWWYYIVIIRECKITNFFNQY